ncbi:(Fe-S)-binding protein [SCandidatus Aminicenantes bacterium Aminicenantia_JdfR_composite]|jgi:Fe-S oxidoreductase|nr:(Fe-S)-binding protein [SCandidatus Aminicenantes bacterium Aminicenantia_JdfR_composite]MCP2597985.1 (Fe-S)-binding protein [Candidatus Aminicenantes bacterium AC-335-L06]
MLSISEIIIFIFVLTLTAYGVFKPFKLKYKLIRLGKPENRYDRPLKRIKDAISSFLLLKCSVKRERIFTGFMHFFILYGFLVFLTVTINHILSGLKNNFSLFGHGIVNSIYSFAVDLFAILVLIGVVYFMIRRYIFKPKSLTYPSPESAIIYLFLFMVISTFLFYEAFTINVFSENSKWAFAGNLLWNYLIKNKLDIQNIKILIHVFWWFHILTVFGFALYIPRSKHLHIVFGPINIGFKNYNPKGILKPIDIERADVFGIEKLTDFTWKDLMDAFTCVECGRCQDYCPASRSEKPLSPKEIILNLKKTLLNDGIALLNQEIKELKPLMNNIYSDDEIWTCTSCGACMQVCPVENEHLPKIIGLRQSQVLMEGKFPSELNQFFRNIETNSNPWGIGFSTRGDWAKDYKIKTVAENPNIDVLLWVGCAGSFDERAKKITFSVIKILNTAGISFGILGKEEKCCGDQARRLGNEYLFQTLAQENIETFKKYNIKKILVTCPHGYHTFKNEYPLLSKLLNIGEWDIEVVHHTEFIFDLIREGKIKLKRTERSITYHDPCYLGRHNSIFKQPRLILNALNGEFIEMKNCGSHSFCCGAGGGLMWTEEKIGKRINHIRTEEAINTGAELISTACPFCLTMLEDGLKEKNKDNECKVKDIAELVAECL